jgi:aminoglycoside phosphotransferase
VRGDACLPNLIGCDDGLTGRIDPGDPGVGQVEADLAPAVWSLRYNPGPASASVVRGMFV